jgi:hypothetical protein
MKEKLEKYSLMLEEDRKKMKRKEMRERKKMYYYMNKKVKMNFKIIDLLYGEILNIIFPENKNIIHYMKELLKLN